jgi:site-specific DNA-methyltransferase (adenine-specific)
MQTKVQKYFRMIKDYPTLFEGAHTVHTPQALVEEIIDSITISGQVLIMFNIEFAVSLVYNYNIDPTSITFYSDHPNKTKIAQQLGIKHITTLDQFMKFDVILANPPYNDVVGNNRLEAKNTNNSNLYFDFIKQSFKLCPSGTVAMIVPAAWMQNDKIRQEVLDAGLQTVSSVDSSHFPGVGIRSGISAFTAVHGYNQNITVKNGPAVYSIGRSATLSFDDPFKFIIVAKIKTNSTLATKLKYGPYQVPVGTKGSIDRLIASTPTFSKTATASHKFKVLIYAGGAQSPEQFVYSTVDQTGTQYGLAIPVASDKYMLGVARMVDPGVGVSDRLKVIYFNNQTQAQNAQAYLNSKLVRFVMKTTKHNDTVNTNKNSFGNIPLVNFNKSWTDAGLYALFNLTQQEIDYIESIVN